MNARTSMNEDGEKFQRLDLEDVTGYMQDLLSTMTIYVDKTFITPKALPLWLAGFRRLEEYATLTPENQGPRRLAYLWMLDALMQSPDALIEAMIEARSQLVAADEALKPFAGR